MPGGVNEGSLSDPTSAESESAARLRPLHADLPPAEAQGVEPRHPVGADHVDTLRPGHADTGSAAGVGGVTGAAIGAAAGPIGAVIGAVGGMIVGAATERAMHHDADVQAEHEYEAHHPEAVHHPRLEIDHGDTVPPPP